MTRSLEQSLGGRSPDQWALDFLAAARFPATPANVQAVVSWEYAESGAGGGMFNPLNTTQGGYPGETDFNSVGVKNYVRYQDGIDANAKVIHNGYYAHVVDLFGVGNDARATCDAITRSPWGTGYIALRGAPAPVPIVLEVDVVLVGSPHRPTIPGRSPAAVWDPRNPNQVLLTNGASIRNDGQQGPHRRVWKPPYPPGRTGVGIFPTIDQHGQPDGKGVVAQDDADDTYIGLWS